jgi:hypothetical protein
VSWKGVQHAPHLPKPMKLWQGSLAAELRHEVSVVQRLAPELPIRLPSGKPNTGPAIALAASQIQRDREGGIGWFGPCTAPFGSKGKTSRIR